MSEPLISVVIPVHMGRERMVGELISSCQQQTVRDWELILVSDGADDTQLLATLLFSGPDSRISVLEPAGGKVGLPRAVNLGNKAASGRYIMPLGSDDVPFVSTMFEEMLEPFATRPDLAMVYSDFWTGASLAGTVDWHQVGPCLRPDEEHAALLGGFQRIPHPGTLWRAEVLRSLPLDESVESGIDFELYLRFCERGLQAHYLASPLWFYRKGHKAEAGTARQARGVIAALERRLAEYPQAEVGLEVFRARLAAAEAT